MLNTNEKFLITILSTGGTIEKTYDEIAGSLENRDSIIQEHVVSKLRLPYTELAIHTIMSKDSLYMTDDDRQMIAQQISTHAQHGYPIIVLHGTDTMVKTLEHCTKTLTAIRVPVIFTGAMKPQEFQDSDALQNVTEALIAAKLLKPGFYLSFHNRIFSSTQVRKNTRKATFEAC